jgi:hypothetical protein
MEELIEEINVLVNSEIQEEQESTKKRKRAPPQFEKDLNGEKMCNECKITKPINEFRIKNRVGIIPYMYIICKDCDNKRNRIYKINNLYRKRYNTSREEVQNKLEEQRGGCEICTSAIDLGERDESFRSITKSTAVIDHCHKTGKNRGLLCNNCNGAIGFFKDSPEICINAANYLKKYLEEHSKTTIKEN